MKSATEKFPILSVKESLLIVVAYWALARLGQVMAIQPGNVTPVWPPSGLALAVVMWRGYRVWPALWLGNFLANVHAFVDFSSAWAAFRTLGTGIAIGPGDLLQAGLGAVLVQRFCSPKPFERLFDVFRFAAFQLIACLSSASFGVLALAAGGIINWSDYGTTWFTWYAGDALGAILTGPILLSIRQLAEWNVGRKRLAESIGVSLLLSFGSWLIFSGRIPSPLLYLLLPLIIWSAVRGGTAAVSLSVLGVFTIAIYFIGSDRFQVFGQRVNLTVITAQTAAAIFAVTGLTVAAALSELRNSEARLRRAISDTETSNARYKTLVQFAPEAIVVMDVDRGQLIDVNQNAESLFGLPRSQLLMKHPADLSPELQPDGTISLTSASEKIAEALRKQNTVFSWTHQSSSGQLIPCEVRLTRLPSADHQLIRASIIDVSTRLAMEQKLRQSIDNAVAVNLRLDLALKAGNVGLWDWDMTTNQVYYSEQFKEQLGYGPDSPLNSYKDWELRLHPDDRESAVKSIADYLAGKTSEYEPVFRMRHLDGTYRWILSQGEVIRDSARKPIRMLGVHIDITERKQFEESLKEYSKELERRNAELDAFAYVASHDLKAPLRGVRQLAEWIGEDCLDVLPAESKRHLEQIIERVNRLDNLLKDLLMYSRAGRIHGSQSIVDVRELIEEIVQSIAVPDQFRISINADVPSIQTFRTPLTQVLSNLITNAIRHHDQKSGAIGISVETTGDHLLFRVQDDGPGIPPQFHERVFEMFVTLKPKDDTESTGIGLAIVRKIVEFYGGRVTIESGGERGTAISFDWPRQTSELDEASN